MMDFAISISLGHVKQYFEHFILKVCQILNMNEKLEFCCVCDFDKYFPHFGKSAKHYILLLCIKLCPLKTFCLHLLLIEL